MSQHWERLAARTGGTVAALATAITANGTPLVFAGTSVGVHRSSDGGRTWTSAGAAGAVPFVEAVAPSPSFARDRTVLLGARDGLYRSLDGGASWRRTLSGGRMLALALAPTPGREPTVLVGTETDGALRSEDGGQSWASANPGLLDLSVLALALSSRFGDDRTGFAATASGLYRTRNGGKSWREVELGSDELVVQCLAVSPRFADDRLVLAGTERDGLLRSRDAGQSWEVVPTLAEGGVAALAFSDRYPARPIIAAATADGVAVSYDGGESWRRTGRALGPVLSLAFVPDDGGEALLAGLASDGIARSGDDGASWVVANDELHASLLVGLALSPAFADDQVLFTVGPQHGVSVSTDGGTTWAERNDGLDDLAVSALALSPDYARDRTLYAATAAGIYRSRDRAATWRPTPVEVTPTAARAIITGPALANAPAPVLAALSGGDLRASDDGGESWRPLGTPFGEGEVISLALSPTYARDRTIFAGTIGAAPDGGGELSLWRSTDGGQQWERWLVERGPGALPLAVPASYPINEVLFVGVGGRVLKPLRHARELRSGARRPIWRGADLGAGPRSVTALAASPSYLGDATLFAASSDGVYVSRDGGEAFKPWSEGLATTAVVALAVSPSYREDRLVYAISLGGSIWRRRDD